MHFRLTVLITRALAIQFRGAQLGEAVRRIAASNVCKTPGLRDWT